MDSCGGMESYIVIVFVVGTHVGRVDMWRQSTPAPKLGRKKKANERVGRKLDARTQEEEYGERRLGEVVKEGVWSVPILLPNGKWCVWEGEGKEGK